MQRCREFELDSINRATYKANMPERGYNMADISDFDEPYPSLEQENMQDAYPDIFDNDKEDISSKTVPLDFYGKSFLMFISLQMLVQLPVIAFPD